MKKLKKFESAATRYLSKYTRKQFFAVFVVITAINLWLAYNVDGYRSIWLAMIGGWFFGMTSRRSTPRKSARSSTGAFKALKASPALGGTMP